MTKKIFTNVKLGKNVIIEDFCVIGKPPKGKEDGELKTIIGDNALIRSHSIIYAGNVIGDDFQSGHHTQIRENNEIGNNVVIGSFSEIAFNTKIGNNVSIHSDCHIFEGTQIEDDVHFNPGVHVLNSKYPYRPGQKPFIEPVTIKKGAIIAARSTLMPGITIGKYALIGAGSLVTKDVSEYAVAYGHPAKEKGDLRELKNKEGEIQYKVK